MSIFKEIENLSNRALADFYAQNFSSTFTSKEDVKLKYNLAGTEKKDIDIEFYENDLIVKVKQNVRFRDHIAAKSFLDLDNVSAKYENGILTVIIPKAPPKTKKIQIT